MDTNRIIAWKIVGNLVFSLYCGQLEGIFQIVWKKMQEILLDVTIVTYQNRNDYYNKNNKKQCIRNILFV